MHDRPRDFFGHEDWTGGDPDDDVCRIKKRQAAWDAEYAKLTWWHKLLFFFGYRA